MGAHIDRSSSSKATIRRAATGTARITIGTSPGPPGPPGGSDEATAEWVESGPLTKAALSAGYVGRKLPRVDSASKPFGDPTRIHASVTMVVLGIDETADGDVYVRDTSNGAIKRFGSYAPGSFQTVNLPTGVTYDKVGNIVRFGDDVYMTSTSAAPAQEVYRSPAVTGATAYTWTLVHTCTTGSTAWGRNLMVGSQHLFLVEYGDPTGGPKIWRSADGAAWEECYHHASSRHLHHIAEDPYRAGHVYASGGDGNGTSLLRSSNYGAPGSWVIVSSPATTQMVQLSFDENWIYGACDSQQGTFLAWDRETLTPRLGSPNYHANHPVVPAAAATDRYYKNAYWGAVDPATGVYYCVANDTSVSGNTQGLFYSPQVGRNVELMFTTTLSLGSPVYVAGGYLWAGQWRKPLLTAAQ